MEETNMNRIAKTLLALGLLAGSGSMAMASAMASGHDNCFFAGTYVGKGFGFDQTGRVYPYEVTTVLNDATEGRSDYTWSNGGKATLNFKADRGRLLIDGRDIGATIQCQMAAANLIIPAPASLAEEVLFVGNYLIRHGQKRVGNDVINYQELLIRQK